MIVRMHYDDASLPDLLAAAGRGSYAELVAPIYDGQPRHSLTYPLNLPGAQRAAYVKIYRPAERRSHFLLRPSKAFSEAMNLRRLAAWGVPTVKVLAVGSRRSIHGLEDAVLITEAWPGSQTLADYAAANWPMLPACSLPPRETLPARRGNSQPGELAEQRAIGRAVSRAVRAMHSHNFYHADLKWRNILVRRRTGGQWQLAIMDCPRGQLAWLLPHRLNRQVRDLAMLDITARVYWSRTERLRWLLDHLGATRATARIRRIIASIVACGDRIVQGWISGHEGMLARTADPAPRTELPNS